jgi:N-acetylglucosamine-6-phosphate deacetylase
VDECSARLLNGTLAGSILTLDRAVANVVRLAGVRVEDALRMAGEAPARALGLTRKGRIAPGCDADLVLLGEGLEVLETIVGGRVVYARPRPVAALEGAAVSPPPADGGRG